MKLYSHQEKNFALSMIQEVILELAFPDVCSLVKLVWTFIPSLEALCKHVESCLLCCTTATCNVAQTPSSLMRTTPTASYVTFSLTLGPPPLHIFC